MNSKNSPLISLSPLFSVSSTTTATAIILGSAVHRSYQFFISLYSSFSHFPPTSLKFIGHHIIAFYLFINSALFKLAFNMAGENELSHSEVMSMKLTWAPQRCFVLYSPKRFPFPLSQLIMSYLLSGLLAPKVPSPSHSRCDPAPARWGASLSGAHFVGLPRLPSHTCQHLDPVLCFPTDTMGKLPTYLSPSLPRVHQVTFLS